MDNVGQRRSFCARSQFCALELARAVGNISRGLDVPAVILAAMLMLVCIGCSPDHRIGRDVDIQSPTTESLVGGARGGTLTVLNTYGFGSIDPGIGHAKFDYEAIYATQRPLFSNDPDVTGEPRPDLAAGSATISSDGEIVTVRIRHGVHFSPPVDREVTSSDVAYAIERGANPNVDNPYFRTYFSDLKGATVARGGRIPGIRTPNRYTIVFYLSTPDARTFVDALALPLSAPVPEEYAKQYDGRKPSLYGDFQVATGPYMFRSNVHGRVIGVGYRPGRSATLVRNPSWRASTDFRPAYLDQIDIKIGGDPQPDANQVLRGLGLVQSDPPPAAVRTARRYFPSELQISPGAGIDYIAVNNKQGPLSNTSVRRAFWAALDRKAMADVLGRFAPAQTASHFLYPGIPAFARADTLVSEGHWFYDKYPQGDLSVAERYMKEAGYSTGRYTGTRILQVVGATGSSWTAIAGIANQTLRRLGFKTHVRLVPRSLMYSKYCGVPAEEIDVCPDVSWRADFGDGQAVFSQTFGGHAISPLDNNNWGQVNDANINFALEREARVVDPSFREEGWSAVDNGLVAQAVAIPYAWPSEAEIESRNILGIGDAWNAGAWDYSFTSLR